jgi:hypothetical protein
LVASLIISTNSGLSAMAISLGIAALAWPGKSAPNCLTTPFPDPSI